MVRGEQRCTKGGRRRLRGATLGETAVVPSAADPVVFVVDDDPSMAQGVESLLRSVGHTVEVFGSTADLMKSRFPLVPGCLVLDVRLPGISGLDFQNRLASLAIPHPIIFMSGHGDIPMSVRAIKAGAIDFLAKPFRDQDMLDAVSAALELDDKARQAHAIRSDLKLLEASLTPKEREIFIHVVSGLMNKQIAGLVGTSEITVKIHRGRVMRKMQARSLADLVRKAESLK